MQPPAADFSTDPFEGFLADRGQERRERTAVSVARLAWPEREPQERERRGGVATTSVVIPAVHDLGLVGMQPQPDLLHPVPDRLPQAAGLAFADAVHHRIVDIAFELHGRVLPG